MGYVAGKPSTSNTQNIEAFKISKITSSGKKHILVNRKCDISCGSKKL